MPVSPEGEAMWQTGMCSLPHQVFPFYPVQRPEKCVLKQVSLDHGLVGYSDSGRDWFADLIAPLITFAVFLQKFLRFTHGLIKVLLSNSIIDGLEGCLGHDA